MAKSQLPIRARSSVQSSGRLAAVHALKKARECFLQIHAHQRTALLKAKEAGDWLSEAKKAVPGEFLTLVKTELKGVKGYSNANVHNYIKIFRKWEELEPLLDDEKHPDYDPNLSIDGALRYLKTGST